MNNNGFGYVEENEAPAEKLYHCIDKDLLLHVQLPIQDADEKVCDDRENMSF